MSSEKTYRAADRDEWRSWLERNHASETTVWVLFPKKHTGLVSMSYEDSVEEALCYGWIDSLVKRIDENMFARKFTPRTNTANWSDTNKRRVAKCIREGRMTAIGMAKISFPNPDKVPAASARGQKPKANVPVPAFIRKALMTSSKAWKNFSSLPPSHQRRYEMWISMAKREETREKRLKEAIKMLTKNERLGLK
jgi:uncharacterized protein YdeI (YjbR/CyaY-like superfamily)